MEREVRSTDQWGRVLWLWNEHVEVGIALEFGIRVVHLSYPGMENLCYVQPNDLTDGFCNSNGWRIYGGHRVFMSPEGSLSYNADNDPVQCAAGKNIVLVEQETDYALNIRKKLRLTFEDDGSVKVENMIENAGSRQLEGATWGVNTLAGGGRAEIAFEGNDVGNCIPKRIVSLWADTNIADPRIRFTKDKLYAEHDSNNHDYFKLGLYCDPGKAIYENKGQRLTISFDAPPIETLSDNGCNFELYICDKFMELETLGKKFSLQRGESASHTEIWKVSKI